MTKHIVRLISILAVCAGIADAQTALTQTTLNGAVSGASNYYGNGTTSIDTSVTLTSVTGVIGPNSPSSGVFASYLYVDREAMGVTSVNTTTKVVGVVRGVLGTNAQDHVTATMVLVGPAGINGAFQAVDPQGNCTAASTTITPWVNVTNGMQWICSTVTKTWVPGFGNPGNSTSPPAVTTAVASVAGATLPSGPLFHITGTNAITSWTVPVGCNATAAGGCSFTVIPDAAFTTTATNNIATAVTAVINLPITWTWDATNSKFVSMQSK